MNREPILITMTHVRRAKMCSRGVRTFFLHNDLDWNSFLKNGISSLELEATNNDAMVRQVIEVAYGGR